MHSTRSSQRSQSMRLTPVGNTSFQELDGLLSTPHAQELDGWCDFSTAFDDSSLDSDLVRGISSSKQDANVVAKVKSRSHKRKVSQDKIEVENSGDSSHIGRWTKKEHELFLQGLLLHGKSWKKISSLVVTRTLVQIRTHAQKYLQKQTKTAMKAAATAAALASASQTESDVETSNKTIKGRDTKSMQKTITIDAQAPDESFQPIAFPSLFTPQSSTSLSVPTSSLLSETTYLHESIDPHSHNQHSMNPIDALLHENEPPLPLQASTSYYPLRHVHNEYNPMSTTNDEELRQWLQHRHLPLNSPLHLALKRRREATSSSSSQWSGVNPMEAMASIPTTFEQFSCDTIYESHENTSHYPSVYTYDQEW